MRTHHLLLLAIIAAFGTSGCDSNDGPAEEMGEALDDTGDNVEDAADDAGDAIEDACEDAKEGADAEDTDC